MNSLVIRTAHNDDISQLKAFEQGVIKAERPFDDTLNQGHIQYYDIDSLICDDQIELVVGEIDQQIIACGYAKIMKAKAYVQYSFYSYLGFMYVAPSNRGAGINKRLINHLAHWSQEQCVFHLHLDVYRDNETAVRAYEKYGFRPYTMEMRCDLRKNYSSP